MLGEGGLPPTTHTTGHRGDRSLRTHPQAKAATIQPWSISIASASRVHRQGIKQRKSNRNGLLWSAYYNVSIHVTNRTRSSSNAAIIYVNNFVRNYSHYLLHTQTTSTIGTTQQHNITSKHLHKGKSKTKQIHIISRGFYGAS